MAVVPTYREPQNSHHILSRGSRGTPEAITDAVCWSVATSLSGIVWKPWNIVNLMWNCLSLKDTNLTSKLNKQGPKITRAAMLLEI